MDWKMFRHASDSDNIAQDKCENVIQQIWKNWMLSRNIYFDLSRFPARNNINRPRFERLNFTSLFYE